MKSLVYNMNSRRAAIVDIDRLNITPEDYQIMYQRFAKTEKEVDDIFCMPLHENQKICGVYYLESYSYSGSHILLINLPGTDKQAIDEAKITLRKNRDVVTITTYRIKTLEPMFTEGLRNVYQYNPIF